MKQDDINGVQHFVFESEAEFRKYHFDEVLVTDWRTAHKGQWTVAEDGGIVQILRETKPKGKKNPHRLLGTIVGTFCTHKWGHMDTDFALHPNRYILSARTNRERFAHDKTKPLTGRQMLVVKHMLDGMTPEEAINVERKRSKPLSDRTMKTRVDGILHDRRVLALIKDAVEQAAKQLKIGPITLIERLNDLSLNAEKEATRLSATQELVELMDLKPSHDRGNPLLLAKRADGDIADAEFRLVSGVVAKGQREAEGKQITNGYDANHLEAEK